MPEPVCLPLQIGSNNTVNENAEVRELQHAVYTKKRVGGLHKPGCSTTSAPDSLVPLPAPHPPHPPTLFLSRPTLAISPASIPRHNT